MRWSAEAEHFRHYQRPEDGGVVESWNWASVAALTIQFGLAAVLVPDMRRRRAQWWWQGLILVVLFPASAIWFALAERREQRDAADRADRGTAR